MLLTPFSLGDLKLANRVTMAPLTRCRTADDERLPNAMMAEYYGQRATAGLIVTEATVVTRDGVGYANTPGIYNDAQVAGWRLITDAVHAKGGRIFCQLWHCGRASHSSFLNGKAPVSASAVQQLGEQLHTPIGKQDHTTPRALETHEVPSIVELFRQGAIRAKEAGFDGVEIHSANGYLIDQFLQSKTNHRTDQYGGSIPNRFRFLREVIEAILTVWPADRVGSRLSPNSPFNDMGSADFRETFLYAAAELDKYKLGYIHVIDGLAFGFHGLGEPMLISEFRNVVKGPLMANCGYTQASAQEALTAGLVNLVAFGRPFITNPDLVERFRAGLPLTPSDDPSYWYGGGAKGYVDYKNA